MHHRFLLIPAAVAACWLSGCPKSSPDNANSAMVPASENVSESGYKRRLVEDLPAVGDFLPPLDEGRIEVAGPDGWNTLLRSSRQLTGFVKGKASELPRIVVTAADPPAADLGDTTEENTEQLAAALDGELRKDAKKIVPEPCLPIVLGDRAFVRHVRLANLSGDPVVIQSLQTIQGGRLYTIELICDVNAADRREYVKSLTKFRDFGYAVAANLKFGGASEPLVAPPAETPPVEAPPAETAPAAMPPAEKPAEPPADDKGKP